MGWCMNILLNTELKVTIYPASVDMMPPPTADRFCKNHTLLSFSTGMYSMVCRWWLTGSAASSSPLSVSRSSRLFDITIGADKTLRWASTCEERRFGTCRGFVITYRYRSRLYYRSEYSFTLSASDIVWLCSKVSTDCRDVANTSASELLSKCWRRESIFIFIVNK